MSGLIKTVGPQAEHTPGPWTVRHRCVDKSPYDDESCGLGLEVDGPLEPQLRGRFARAADAHLVAAAPELLAALTYCEAVMDEAARDQMLKELTDAELGKLWTDTLAATRAAIVKARGEADPTSEDEERPA